MALYTGFDRPLADAELDAYRVLVKRRAAREPVAYLLGEREFRSRSFRVTPAVLIPRPETEDVVDAALETIADRTEPLVADLGTGSGCIAVSIAVERPDARVHALDVSAPALAVARENASRHGVTERVTFVEGDFAHPLGSPGSFDLVVSNPPYVAQDEMADLAPEVRDHEPARALTPGPDAFSAYRAVIAAASRLLRPGGALVLELPNDRTAELRALAPEGAEVRTDLAGHDRILIVRVGDSANLTG